MHEGDRKRIALLGVSDPSTRIVYRALSDHFTDVIVILEQRVPRRQLLLRRAQRLGVGRALGQALFVTGAVPVLRILSSSRVEEIKRRAGLDDRPLSAPIVRVTSVNSDEARRTLKAVNPVVTVVNGTRIIDADTLSAVGSPLINVHAGITPSYRGVHGGYWALREGRPDLVGTTIHLIDEGIDTGEIVQQVFFDVTTRDSFATYPYLHLAAGIPALIEAVQKALEGTLITEVPANDLPPSKLHYHPTLWEYLNGRVRQGVK
jgi:folate-dependent phosphoribosylglycinamide formyltransferase PurN